MKPVTETLYEVFTPDIDWVVEELTDADRASGIDGKYVIGRVKGQFFVPDGESRNGRFYPESLWNRVVGNDSVKNKLSERKMFGTIGHDEEPVSEQQLRRGEVSHIITKLWIEPDSNGRKRGMGEALILNTDAGRNLNVYLRAGSRLNTSSRASGKYLEGAEKNGIPVVDENAYVFETFDFVLDPGFLEARPDLVEQMQAAKEENYIMSDDRTNSLVEASLRTLSESRDALQKQLDEAIAGKSSAEARLQEVQERLKKIEKHGAVLPVIESLGVTSEVASRLPRILEDLGVQDFPGLVKLLEKISPADVAAIREGNVGKKLEILAKYQKQVSATPEKGVQIGERASKEIAAYRKFGTTKDVAAKMEELSAIKRQLRSVGTITEAKKALGEAATELRAFAKLGTRREIEEALRSSLTLLQQYREVGTPSKISEALAKADAVVARVNKMGGLAKIGEAIKKYNESVRKRREQYLSNQSETLSSRFRVPVDGVRPLVESVGAEKAEKILAGVNRTPSEKITERSDGTKVTRKLGTRSLVETMFSQATAKLGQKK